MNVLIVGNILKDVYLNLDTRDETIETDANGTGWLNLSFDASKHRFFNRTSNFGGAAVSLEVLNKLGITGFISNSDFTLKEDLPALSEPVATYRYILSSDGGVSYFSPSQPTPTTFIVPDQPVDYLYIDRSAHLTQETFNSITNFLANSPNTKLVLYLKKSPSPCLEGLVDKAALIFAETFVEDLSATKSLLASVDPAKIVYVSEEQLSYLDITEKITTPRIDTLTHLSAYSIISATILGSFILGKTVEESLKLARINVENSTLNSVLSLAELEKISETADPSENLELIAASLVVSGKGILAADESGGSIKKKFAQLNIDDTFKNRHDYRDIFFTTPNLEDYVSGVILFDETARDYAANGETYTDFLISKRILPGIKVDQGLEKFENSEETYTKGLDGLASRLKEYYTMGLRFAKWRAAFNLTLSDAGEILTPTRHCIEENCHILAEYAKECQSAGIVPIVEPEVVYDGYYSIQDSAKVTGKILDSLFKHLVNFNVNLKGCILKVNMVIAGKKFSTSSTPEEVGKETARVLKEHVPSQLAGVVFLSGGQTVEQATDNLAAVEKNGPFPWPVTFSFARALQDPALFAWAGDNSNVEKAKDAFMKRLIANKEALNS